METAIKILEAILYIMWAYLFAFGLALHILSWVICGGVSIVLTLLIAHYRNGLFL